MSKFSKAAVSIVRRADVYSYPSSVLTINLDDILSSGEVAKIPIPQGVFVAARGLARVLRQIGEAKSLRLYMKSGDSPKQLSYNWDLVNEISAFVDVVCRRTVTVKKLTDFAVFIESMRTPRRLTDQEIETARLLRLFLDQLQKVGEALHYPVTGPRDKIRDSVRV